MSNPATPIEQRVAALEQQLADLLAVHGSHELHVRRLDARRVANERAVFSAVAAEQQRQRIELEARAKERPRVRVRSIGQVVEVALRTDSTGRVRERLALDPSGKAGNVSRTMLASEWRALIAGNREVAELVVAGALVADELPLDEAIKLEAREGAR